MKLFNVTEIERLFETLDQCKGDVKLIAADGTTFNWKESSEKVKSFARALPLKKLDRVELRLENERDFDGVLRYMMQAN